MSKKLRERAKKFNQRVKDAEILLSIVRDSDLQQTEVINLSDLLLLVSGWKK